MLFYADTSERLVSQLAQVVTVVVMLGAILLLIRQLNNPFHEGIGGLEPTAMERTLNIIEVQLADEIEVGPLPCNEDGVPQ
jgi:hypothetical protein